MSNGSPLTESVRGYLSGESKRRFTVVAGVLGGAFFLAQIVLPMAVMFMVMMPMMTRQEIQTIDLDQAALWRDELWYVQRTVKVNRRARERSSMALALGRVRLTDLQAAGPALPLESSPSDTGPALVVAGDRLWAIGADTVSSYQGGSLRPLGGAQRPTAASRPFVHGGLPAVVSLGTPPALATLHVDGGEAEWRRQEISLGLPPEGGSLKSLQAVEAGGRLYLFAQLCTVSPEQCSLRYRELQQEAWLPVVEEICDCGRWSAVALGATPAVVLSERDANGRTRLAVVTVAEGRPRRQSIQTEGRGLAWLNWRAFPVGTRLLLFSEGMSGGLRLQEVVDGRVVRSLKRVGSFPFGPEMMLLMLVPQSLPIVLSLVLAFLLTIQMRRHRVDEYVAEHARAKFASLWQRALAQVVDIVPFAAGFAVPMTWMWRTFSDPERLIESGPFFPLRFFGLALAAFAWGVLVLLAYSYGEGRWGKTPGKWLLGIRVLGTDLRPCGFGRAALRNLLIFADGFFSFLVGAMLVALSENWQRLGDLAARTIVVADRKPA